jgi:hypothetical protein
VYAALDKPSLCCAKRAHPILTSKASGRKIHLGEEKAKTMALEDI